MCVALHWSLFPLLSFIIFCATLVLLTSIALIVYFVVREQTEARVLRSRKTSPETTFWSSPLTWTKDMLSRAPIYTALRRQFSNAATVIRWKNATEAKFDHEQIIHDARWQAFWRERVIPASNEFIRSGIPLDDFPVVRQTQLGLAIAYSMDFVRDIFARKEVDEAVATPKERYVLILRSPKTESNDEIEPAFKEVVTDMLQFKQVCLEAIN